jgi:hypothetical protein
MAAIPGGRLSRGEIIQSALTRVGNNESSLVQAARVRLNRILAELYLNWDWPFLYREIPVALTPAGQIALPADFLKSQDDYALVITSIEGQPARRRVSETDRMTFERTRAITTQQGTPRVWHADRSTGMLLFTPASYQGVSASFRYKFLPPDMPTGTGTLDQTGVMDPITVAYDADVPIFAYAVYLSDVVLEWAMGYESDPRQSQQKADNMSMFQTLRGATFPPHAVFPLGPGLDPDVFGPPFGGSEGES